MLPLSYRLAGPFTVTSNTFEASQTNPLYGILWLPGASAAGAAGAGYPLSGAINNNAFGPTRQFASAGIYLQDAGPDASGAAPTINVGSNSIMPGVTTATKIVLNRTSAAISATAPFYVNATHNAFAASGSAASDAAALGPDSVTVAGYEPYAGLAAALGVARNTTAKDRVYTSPWLKTYTTTASTTGFSYATFTTGSVAGDPHFVGFDVSLGFAAAGPGGARGGGQGGAVFDEAVHVVLWPAGARGDD